MAFSLASSIYSYKYILVKFAIRHVLPPSAMFCLSLYTLCLAVVPFKLTKLFKKDFLFSMFADWVCFVLQEACSSLLSPPKPPRAHDWKLLVKNIRVTFNQQEDAACETRLVHTLMKISWFIPFIFRINCLDGCQQA